MTTLDFTARFVECVDESIAYVARYNLQKSVELVDRIELLISNIRQFPESYRSRDYLPAFLRRCSFRISARYSDEYAIFYSFDEGHDHVTMHALFPGYMNFGMIFSEWF